MEQASNLNERIGSNYLFLLIILAILAFINYWYAVALLALVIFLKIQYPDTYERIFPSKRTKLKKEKDKLQKKVNELTELVETEKSLKELKTKQEALQKEHDKYIDDENE